MHNAISGRILLVTSLTFGVCAAATWADDQAPAATTVNKPADSTSGAQGHAKMVAYDAKDRKYYSVDYAKQHGMHDRGGDPLVIIARSKLPKDAKLSHAMHGIEP